MGRVLEEMSETQDRLQNHLELEAKVAMDDISRCVCFTRRWCAMWDTATRRHVRQDGGVCRNDAHLCRCCVSPRVVLVVIRC